MTGCMQRAWQHSKHTARTLPTVTAGNGKCHCSCPGVGVQKHPGTGGLPHGSRLLLKSPPLVQFANLPLPLCHFPTQTAASTTPSLLFPPSSHLPKQHRHLRSPGHQAEDTPSKPFSVLCGLGFQNTSRIYHFSPPLHSFPSPRI